MTETPNNIAQAVQILRNGGLVAFPTETVYGLGADASNELAVTKVFQIKGRPADHPLIVHLANPHQLTDWALDVPENATKLAKAFWPGPLTIVLKKRPNVLACVTGGQDTVALRMPRHPIAIKLLEAFGKGLVAPSANRFTRISPTTASAVREEFGQALDWVLDGGACEVGLESTIVDLSGKQPVILRPGMISAKQISEVLGKPVATAYEEKITTRAPGMHHLHYAPVTNTHLIKSQDIPSMLSTLNEADLPIVCAVYSNVTFPSHKNVHWVKLPAQAKTYAHELYRTLRALDQQHYKSIWIEAVPEDAEWEAIRDRLNKATGKQSL